MEEFKDIQGKEGRYRIGTKGTIFSVHSNRALKQKAHTHGYLLGSVGERGKWLYVHRLVAKAFLPNPQGLREVNHINGIKTDNRVENLEWVSHRDNVRHSYKTGLSKRGAKHVQSKGVAQYAIDGTFIKNHGSTNEAAKAVGGLPGNIGHCCRERQPTAYGYKWRHTV